MTDDKLTLHYFNTKGRAELIRYILHYAGRQFEDKRYTKEEWLQHKANFPTGQIPVLEIVKDGKTQYLTQSLTIARSLARLHGLTGANEQEAARADEIIDSLNELINLTLLGFFETDIDRKEKIKMRLVNEEYPRILDFLERTLVANGGKHMVGSNWTWADFGVSLFFHGILARSEDSKTITEKLPHLVALAGSVEEIPQIAAWIKIRPETFT